MVATIETLRLDHPEFDSVDIPYVQRALDRAAENMASEAEWVASYDNAQIALACHYLKLQEMGRDGVSGPISSFSSKGESVSFGNSTGSGSYESTLYGQEFLQKLRENYCGGVA